MTALLVVLGILVVIAGAGALSYNQFVAQRNAIDATWGTIDVELQRRHDLIPNLVETVKGYAAHEEQVFRLVTEARTRAMERDRDPNAGPAAQAREENALTGAIRSLFAVAEGYPDLKASQNFLELQRQLVETEDRIAAARRLYNIDVMQYNRRTEAVPSNLIAGMFSFARRDLFELEDRAIAAPPAASF